MSRNWFGFSVKIIISEHILGVTYTVVDHLSRSGNLRQNGPWIARSVWIWHNGLRLSWYTDLFSTNKNASLSKFVSWCYHTRENALLPRSMINDILTLHRFTWTYYGFEKWRFLCQPGLFSHISRKAYNLTESTVCKLHQFQFISLGYFIGDSRRKIPFLIFSHRRI